MARVEPFARDSERFVIPALDPSPVIPSDLSFGYLSAELKSPVKIPILEKVYLYRIENRNYKAHFLKMFVYLYTTNAVMPHPQPGTGQKRTLPRAGRCPESVGFRILLRLRAKFADGSSCV